MDGLTDKIRDTYRQAAREIRQKLDRFTAAHRRKSAQMLERVKAGKLSMHDYQKWLQGQVFIGERWREKLDDVTRVYVHADEVARKIVGDSIKNEFVRFANDAAEDMERHFRGAISFDLYDKTTVTRLLKDNPKMLPEWKIDKPKDYIWNEKRVQNAVTQGIIQGEPISDIANRLCTDLATSNARKMDNFARTAVTGAQNAGRIDRMHQAQNMGIRVRKKWLASHDDRVRDSHAQLDGQEAEVDEDFVTINGNHIAFPGDPSAPPEEVYNCRCTLLYVYPDFESSAEAAVESKEEEPQYDHRHGYESDEKTFTQKDTYTESEKKAIHEYTTSSYSGVNSALREGTVEKYESVKRIVDEIDSAMEKTVVSEGTLASRGASMADLRGMFEDKKRSWFEDPDNLKSLEGQTAPFKSYISATKGESVAEPYMRELQWHFTTEGEVHGIDAEQFASSSVKAEREILFDRDVLIEIEKVKVNVDSDGDIDGAVEIWAKIKQSKSEKVRREEK